MSMTTESFQMANLEHRIVRCERCSEGPVVSDWLPISYYGDYVGANAWVITINPSDREFLDRNGQVRSGDRQRFSRLADFPSATRRSHLTDEQAQVALDRQSVVFLGSPYKAFFEKLGRFLVMVHGADLEAGGLRVFTSGVTSKEGRGFRYSHMDTVKCATQQPWGRLNPTDREMLLSNCLGFTEEQFRTKVGLKLMLINGRTAFSHCQPFLEERFGYAPTCHKVAVGRLNYEIWVGNIDGEGLSMDVVGWSPNIVNSRIRTSEAQILAAAIREACSGLR